MPRADKEQVINADLELFLERGIDEVRRTRTGRISSVHHVTDGWMDAKDWWKRERFAKLLAHPAVRSFIDGGYQLNARVYSTSIEIRGLELPLGGGLLAWGVLRLATSLAAQDLATASKFLVALLAPYGSVYLLWLAIMRAVELAEEVAKGITPESGALGLGLTPIVGPVLGAAIAKTAGDLQEEVSNLFGGGGTAKKA